MLGPYPFFLLKPLRSKFQKLLTARFDANTLCYNNYIKPNSTVFYVTYSHSYGLIKNNFFIAKEVRKPNISTAQSWQTEHFQMPSYLEIPSISKAILLPVESSPKRVMDQNQKVTKSLIKDKSNVKSRKKGSLKIASKRISDYLALSKHNLSVWVSLNSLPGLFLSGTISPQTFLYVTLGTYISSGSAASLNNLIERNRDSLMFRTRLRPLAAGRIQPSYAQTFSVVSGLTGLGILGFGCSITPSVIAAITIGLYAYVYTPMKVISPYNTHVGAITGSLPILIGCSAAGNSLLSPEPWVLFMIQTLWQFPHFYALAWLHKEDYTRAGYKMFPLTDSSGLDTADRCQRYIMAMTLLPFLTSYYNVTSWMFAVDSLIPNLITYYYLRNFKINPTKKNLRKFFFLQLWQLLALLILAAYHCRSMLQQKNFKSIYDCSEDDQNNLTNINFFDQIRHTMAGNCTYMLLENFIPLKQEEKKLHDSSQKTELC